jgi:hypothetical protein
MGEDEIQIYTYILIKNFEVMELTPENIEEVNIYNIGSILRI